jgi:hypothetical protein
MVLIPRFSVLPRLHQRYTNALPYKTRIDYHTFEFACVVGLHKESATGRRLAIGRSGNQDDDVRCEQRP